MKKTARFVIWICSKFTGEEIEEIISGLLDVLANRNPTEPSLNQSLLKGLID